MSLEALDLDTEFDTLLKPRIPTIKRASVKKVEPLRVNQLHPKQALVFNDHRRFKVVVAGRRFGKTALSRSILTQKAQRPRSKVWYVAPSYRMAKQIMWEELKEAIPKKWIKGKPHETDLILKLINGSRIECKGSDDPDSLRGVGLYHVVMDEFQDMKPDTWSAVLRPTLAKDRGGAMFLGTPKGYNNLYDVYENGQDIHKRDWASWQFPTIDSPFIPIEEIEAAKEDMDERTFRQEFLASFETMSGRVYYAFNRKKHVKSCPYNPNLPVWVGQDFNVDPMCSVILQPQPNGEIWAVDEIFMKNSNTVEVCDELERRYWRRMKDATIYPDPSGVSRHSTRGESNFDIFRQRGFDRLKYHSKHPKVVDRINAVNRMLLDANGNIRLYVDPSLKNMIVSFEQTMYKEGSSEVDKSKKPSPEHMSDAMGYLIEMEYPIREIVIAGRSL